MIFACVSRLHLIFSFVFLVVFFLAKKLVQNKSTEIFILKVTTAVFKKVKITCNKQ